MATTATVRATATAVSTGALSATSAALGKGRDIVSLGGVIILLQALETNIELHNRVEVLKLLVVNQDSSLDRDKGQVLHPLLKVMDLHCFPDVRDIMFRKGREYIVLLHMGSTVLVEIIVLAVATIEQILEGCDDVVVHGVNLVPPKEMGVESGPDVATVLCACEFLHMLPYM